MPLGQLSTWQYTQFLELHGAVNQPVAQHSCAVAWACFAAGANGQRAAFTVPTERSLLCCALSCLFRLQVCTLIAAGFVSGLLFAIFTFTPGRFETNDLVALRDASLYTTNSTLQGLDTYAAAQQPANTALSAEVAQQQSALKALGNPNKTWISNQGVIDSLLDASQLQAAQIQP